jgi:hypothetical protein
VVLSNTFSDGVLATDRWRRRLLRLAGAVLAIGLLTLLMIASRLEPSASGLGTHHQLGLPPCSIRLLFSVRCPSCGMTTAWAHFANGSFLAAAQSNLGGMLLAVYSLGCVATGAKMMISGRTPSERVIQIATIALAAIALVTLGEWGLRLMT